MRDKAIARLSGTLPENYDNLRVWPNTATIAANDDDSCTSCSGTYYGPFIKLMNTEERAFSECGVAWLYF